jgi:two-component system CheB/CheR fusion protein
VPVAQLVVDPTGAIAIISERARLLFGLTAADIGRPIQDLTLSYRPIELRSLLEQVSIDRRPILARDVEWVTTSAEPRWFDIEITPLIDHTTGVLGASVTFLDVTAAKRLRQDLEHAHHALETAYEELRSTNEALATTNEELQSRIEEMERTNGARGDRRARF